MEKKHEILIWFIAAAAAGYYFSNSIGNALPASIATSVFPPNGIPPQNGL